MIYTLTINPAVDLNLDSKKINPSTVNRTTGAVYTPNGKGVNVSRVARHFGEDSIAMGFFGGFTGQYIVDDLRKEGLKVMPIWVDDITRINIFLNDTEAEYKFVNEGSVIQREQQKEMLKLVRLIKKDQLFVISGSMAKGISDDYYDEIMEIVKENELRVVLDISSPKLKELLQYQPFLIKPNDEEVEEVWGLKLKTEQDYVEALQFLHKEGAQNILLTLGAAGMYFYNGMDIYFCTAPKVALVSSACAGDGALASFLYHLEKGNAISDCMKISSAVGADIAGSAGIGELKRYPEYLEGITVRKIEV